MLTMKKLAQEFGNVVEAIHTNELIIPIIQVLTLSGRPELDLSCLDSDNLLS